MYTLYMDESETYNSSEQFFVMSGIIIDDNDYSKIKDSLNNLKKVVWDNAPGCQNYILHEKEVSFANNRLNRSKLSQLEPYNRIFTSNAKVVLLYNELSKIIRSNNLNIIGVCLPKKKQYSEFGGQQYLNNQFTVCIQLLMEHYCQFLITRKSRGHICYEAMQPIQNAVIQQRIYELMALGTMHYTPNTIQNHVESIEFVRKSENYAGLQLADFVPNTLGRYVAGKQAKNLDFSRNIRRKLYDGGIADGKDQFGLKILGI